MIWLTWRQFRVSALAVFGVLVVVVVALAQTGPGLAREYHDLRAACGGASCGREAFDDFFFSHAGVYFGLVLLVMTVPVVVGVFWGAPLISREFETGTQDLVWQQSVTRRHWLAVKLGLVVLAAIAAAGLAVAAVSWWSRPLDATAFGGLSRLSPGAFDTRGYAVLGHAAFAVTLGAAAGLLIRRTVPTMAVTFAVFVAVQIVMPMWVRPHLATPVRLETVITADNNLNPFGPGEAVPALHVGIDKPGAWILTNQTVDSAGRSVDTLPDWVAGCATPEEPSGEIVQQQCFDRLAAAGYRQVVTYHPADRFWPFQAYETAIFGILTLLLAGFCFLRIRPS
jgi:hypothetical protein